MSVEDVQLNVQWIKGRLSFVALHGAETLASSFVDPTDEESIAKLVVDVSSANGFTDAERDRLAQDVELAIRAEAKNAPEPLPEPVDLDCGEPLPSFPVDLLPVPAARWVHAWSARMECAPEIAAGVVMAAIFSVLQRGLVIDIDPAPVPSQPKEGSAAEDDDGGWVGEPMGAWIVVIAPPSAGKSPIFRYAMKPINRWIKQKMEDWRKDMEYHRSLSRAIDTRQAECEKRLAKCGDPGEMYVIRKELKAIADEKASMRAPPCPDFVVSDATKESLRKKFDETQGYVAIMDDEAIFLNNFMGGRYAKSAGSDETDAIRKAFSGDELKTFRVSSEFSYDGSCYLTILQAIQPHAMKTFQDNEAAMERGTFARFLFLWPSFDNIGKRHHKRIPIPQDVSRDYREMMTRLITQTEARFGNPARFTLTPEAMAIHEQVNLDFEGSRTGADYRIVQNDGKMFGSVLVRVAAMLLACERGLDSGAQIDESHMERAIEITKVFRKHLERTLNLMGEAPSTADAKVVSDLIWNKMGAPEQVECSKVNQKMRHNRNWHPDRTRAAMDILVKFGHGWMSKKGRRVMFELNPRVLDPNATQKTQI